MPDVEAFPDHIACSSTTQSELVLPVWNGKGQLLGVLDLDSDTPAAFTPEDEAWLTPLLAEVFQRRNLNNSIKICAFSSPNIPRGSGGVKPPAASQKEPDAMTDITLLDGGMGQELVARSGDDPTPLWATRVMLDHPGLVRDIHADYFAAGATIATTNTYAIHHDRLEPRRP